MDGLGAGVQALSGNNLALSVAHKTAADGAQVTRVRDSHCARLFINGHSRKLHKKAYVAVAQ